MAQYSIGGYELVTLSGLNDRGEPPPIPRPLLLPIVRPGVDGAGFVRLGNQAEPAQLYSAVDVATSAAADVLYIAYRSLIGEDPVDIVWRDVSWSALHATVFQILDVRLLNCRRLAAASGGLNGGNYWVEALWTVHPLPAE